MSAAPPLKVPYLTSEDVRHLSRNGHPDETYALRQSNCAVFRRWLRMRYGAEPHEAKRQDHINRLLPDKSQRQMGHALGRDYVMTAHDRSFPPYDDHWSLWYVGGRPVAYVSQPYRDVDSDAVEVCRRWAEAHGLELIVSDRTWWNPGRTILMVFALPVRSTTKPQPLIEPGGVTAASILESVSDIAHARVRRIYGGWTPKKMTPLQAERLVPAVERGYLLVPHDLKSKTRQALVDAWDFYCIANRQPIIRTAASSRGVKTFAMTVDVWGWKVDREDRQLQQLKALLEPFGNIKVWGHGQRFEVGPYLPAYAEAVTGIVRDYVYSSGHVEPKPFRGGWDEPLPEHER